ncbi:hypothetical protein [Photobacterium damselae]|uniref:hypothetical protein n=1 Tax=Photobacterium damselae TaxID=38293 RepID=UPI001F3186DD|nr:hypothetical protein [Photobacterium damselae]UKA11862.1 hypothetical protein IHC91_18970 [Photobacterium damselae subsp. damselae]
MKIVNYISLISLLSFSSGIVIAANDTDGNSSPAIAIDSLVKFADKNNSAYISIINSGKTDAYISTKMAEIKVENNKLVKKLLNVKNMSNWKLFLNPSKLIIRAGEEKKIKVSYKCGSKCNITKDLVYQIPITPVPYNDEKGVSSVSMAFGFSPYFIIPATKSQVDYDYTIKNNRLNITNKGNTYINAVISVCQKEQKNDCIYEYKVLSGRNMDFKLPNEMIRKGSGLMTVVNYDQSYRKTDKVYFN